MKQKLNNLIFIIENDRLMCKDAGVRYEAPIFDRDKLLNYILEHFPEYCVWKVMAEKDTVNNRSADKNCLKCEDYFENSKCRRYT